MSEYMYNYGYSWYPWNGLGQATQMHRVGASGEAVDHNLWSAAGGRGRGARRGGGRGGGAGRGAGQCSIPHLPGLVPKRNQTLYNPRGKCRTP